MMRLTSLTLVLGSAKTHIPDEEMEIKIPVQNLIPIETTTKLSKNSFCCTGSKKDITLADPTLEDFDITSLSEIFSPSHRLSLIGLVFPILIGSETSIKVCCENAPNSIANAAVKIFNTDPNS